MSASFVCGSGFLMLHLGFALLALSWLVPNHYPPWMSFQSEWVACLGACFLGLGAAIGKDRVIGSSLAALALAVAAVPIIQWAAGKTYFHADAWLSAAYVLGFGLCVITGATLITSRTTLFLEGLFGGFVFAATLSAGIALSQWLDVGKDLFTIEIAIGGRPYGNLGQPNHLATLLVLGLVGLVRWFQIGRISSTVLSIGSAWLGFALAMTQSRTAWVSVSLLAAWYAFQSRRTPMRLWPRNIAAGVGAFVLIVLAWRPLNDALLISIATELKDRVAPAVRLTHWQNLWEAVMVYPWTGYGWMQVSAAQLAVAERHAAGGELLFFSHNVVMDLLVWNGVVVAAVILFCLLLWTYSTLSRCKTFDQVTLLAAVTAVAVHAMLEYPLSYAYFLLPFGLMMGALDGLKVVAPPRRWIRWPFTAAVVASVVMTVITADEYLKVEQAARLVRLVSAGIGVDRVSRAPPPDTWLVDSQREYIRFIDLQVKSAMPAEQLDWMRDVSRRFTYASTMFKYASAAALNGRAEESRQMLVAMCNIHGKERCDEGRQGWAELQRKYPQISAISFPP